MIRKQIPNIIVVVCIYNESILLPFLIAAIATAIVKLLVRRIVVFTEPRRRFSSCAAEWNSAGYCDRKTE
jgi:predicted PurR-regulated permease PerM